jgi:hypothetical protein
MCACTETDVRESANDCTLASGEGLGSGGETLQPIYVASPVSSSVEHPVPTYTVHKRLHSFLVTPSMGHCINLTIKLKLF